jgi:organic hydroperoxide reductase OsmC/OhrA
VEWLRNAETFGREYVRDHTWTFDSGVVMSASAAPHLYGDPTRFDPEEMYVAAISSCHILWFLHLAGQHEDLHHRSHELCFIANSVRTSLHSLV